MSGLRVAVLTVSDLGSRGERADESGDAIAAWAEARGDRVVDRALVPDESSAIVPRLLRWADGGEVDLVLTTGGTGFSPRDGTPEATRAVLEREAPGIPGVLLARGMEATPFALLSRGVAGIRGGAVIVNLPGSPGGVRDGLEALDGSVDHAVRLAQGQATRHRQSPSGAVEAGGMGPAPEGDGS